MTHGVNWAKAEHKIIQYAAKNQYSGGGLKAHFTDWSVGMSAKNLKLLTSAPIGHLAFSYPLRRIVAFLLCQPV